MEVFLLESIAKGLVWDLGIKYLIIEGGAKQLGNKLYYMACKQAISYRLAYSLRFGTPEATAFFNKQLVKTIEIFDLATERYIKFDPATGETFVGKVIENENTIVYESYGKISVSPGLTESQQANYVVERIGGLVEKEIVTNAGNILEKYKVAIFDKVKVIAKDESLPQWIKECFLDNYYYTAEALENVSVFRRFGGGANQAVNGK